MKCFSKHDLKLTKALSWIAFLAALPVCPLAAQANEGSYQKKAMVSFREAEDFFSKGDPIRAITSLDECLYFAPGYSEAYLLRALAKRRTDDLEGANTDYNIFLELEPNQPEALFGRGTVRYDLGFYQLAQEDLSKLLRLPPQATNGIFYQLDQSGMTNTIFTAQGGMKHAVFNYLGLIALHSDDPETAVACLDSALVLRPDEADYHVNRALAYEKLDMDSAALVDYRRALELDPDNSLAKYNMAQAALRSGRFGEAEGYFTEAIESNPRLAFAWTERGVFKLNQGDTDAAIGDFSKSLELDPRNGDTWFNRALAYEKANRYREAFTDYTEAINLKENMAKAWLGRGNVLGKMGRHADAIEDYSAAITSNPGYALAYYNRAIAHDHLKHHQQACADLAMAEKLGMQVSDEMKAQLCTP